MKKLFHVASVSALALTLAATPLTAQDDHGDHDHGEEDTPMAGPSGVYGGSYVCQDGEHGIYLEISATDSIIDPDDNGVQQVVGWNLTGVLGFFPTVSGKDGPSGMVTGAFEVEGSWSTKDMGIYLMPGKWLKQPDNYGAAELVGTLAEIAPGQWQIVGKPVVPGMPDFCSDLIATQFVPVG